MIDVDGLFETFFRKYLAKNAGKFTEEELENKVGEIYSEFGKTVVTQQSFAKLSRSHYHGARDFSASQNRFDMRNKLGNEISYFRFTRSADDCKVFSDLNFAEFKRFCYRRRRNGCLFVGVQRT